MRNGSMCGVILGLLLILCYPCGALQVTNSPGIYSSTNTSTITHVFYCSLDPWDHQSSREVLVTSSSPLVTNISPRSFVLPKDFTLPVEVELVSRGHAETVITTFTIASSGVTTTGLIELQGTNPAVIAEVPVQLEEREIPKEKIVSFPFPLAHNITGLERLQDINFSRVYETMNVPGESKFSFPAFVFTIFLVFAIAIPLFGQRWQ